MTTAILTEHESASPTAQDSAEHAFGEDYEVVAGLIVEEPPLGAWEGCIATTIAALLDQFVRGRRLGRVASEVLFVLGHQPRLHRKPDVAFVSVERWALTRPVARVAAWDVIPDLAVEVVSPSDPAAEVQAKVAEYFAAGVRLVWVVYPDQREIYSFEAPRTIRVLTLGDVADGGVVLPGFTMSLDEVFEAAADEPPSVES